MNDQSPKKSPNFRRLKKAQTQDIPKGYRIKVVNHFWNFCRNQEENKDHPGRPWTADPIIEALWNLQSEEEKERIFFARFKDIYKRTIEKILHEKREVHGMTDLHLFQLVEIFTLDKCPELKKEIINFSQEDRVKRVLQKNELLDRKRKWLDLVENLAIFYNHHKSEQQNPDGHKLLVYKLNENSTGLMHAEYFSFQETSYESVYLVFVFSIKNTISYSGLFLQKFSGFLLRRNDKTSFIVSNKVAQDNSFRFLEFTEMASPLDIDKQNFGTKIDVSSDELPIKKARLFFRSC